MVAFRGMVTMKLSSYPPSTAKSMVASALDAAGAAMMFPGSNETSIEAAINTTINLLVNNTHDVCFVDHLLPNCSVDGLELIGRVNAGGCNRPVILVTSMSDEDVEWAAEEAGAACFLNRPADMDPRIVKHAIRFSTSHFIRLKEIQAQLVLMKAQLADICRKLNRG